MQTILVATDLSERSERAVRRAFDIAKAQKARLIVVSVVDDDLPATLAQTLLERSQEEIERFCGSISDFPVEIRVEAGDPLEVIHAIAEAVAAGLVVLGVHRERPLLDMFTGTTVERLVRASTRPVLLVRDRVDHDYERIICGIDLSRACLDAANVAAALAPKGSITTFHAVNIPFKGFLAPNNSETVVGESMEQARHELDKWLAEHTLPAQCGAPQVVALAPEEALWDHIRRLQPQLLAMGAHSRPAYSPNYLGGLTESLLRRPPCDLLVVRR